MIKKIARRRPLSRLEDGELPPLLRRIYENRNVRARSELDYSLKRLLPPARMKGIDAAAELLQKALDADWKILIIGDYDADGATATALALLGLRAFGAQQLAYVVPNRFEDGYGLSPKVAETALARAPDMVITVDNGISSIDGVAKLRAAGVRVIVTDHHLAGARLPDADAIVNPNQPGCGFASKALAGVGVMFYLRAPAAPSRIWRNISTWSRSARSPIWCRSMPITASWSRRVSRARARAAAAPASRHC